MGAQAGCAFSIAPFWLVSSEEMVGNEGGGARLLRHHGTMHTKDREQQGNQTVHAPAYPAEPPVCAACSEIFPVPGSSFCMSCTAHLQRMDRTGLLARIGLRFVAVFVVEVLFGLFAGFLVFVPVAAMVAPHPSPSAMVLIVGFNFTLMSTILASVYTWSLRSWVRPARPWAILNTIGALLPGALMLLAVACGLRLTTLPADLLTLLVIGVEWVIGMGIAWRQQAYLRQPFQSQRVWMRASSIGWCMGAVAHALGSAWITVDGLSLWMGTAASYAIAGCITHGALARFALLAVSVQQLQLDRLRIRSRF
jgi:hypothetical protein